MQPAGKATILKKSSQKKGDFRELYNVGKKLGEGTFGTVFDCTSKSGDPTIYAVKMLEHQSSWFGAMSRSANVQWEVFAQEFEMLSKMEHVNVIKLFDVFADTHFLYFVMDKYENSLIAAALPLLQKGKKAMPNACLGEITSQMLASIVYLHDQKIVHRDVKADNYLVDSNNFRCNQFKVVLTDLSTARYLEDGVYLKDMLGTMQYWAPEIIARYYAHKVDCWAIGVILWCMLTLKFPFNTVQETYTKKLTIRPDKMTNEQFDLVQLLLDKNPIKRISARDAMAHGFISESVEKHKQMILKAKQADDDDDDQKGTVGGDGDKDAGMNFGDSKLAVPADVLERRQRNLNDSAEAFERGDRNCMSMQELVDREKNGGAEDGDVVAKDKQRTGEAKNYSWWSEQRCKEKSVPDVNTNCLERSNGTENDADSDPAREQAGDLAFTEPSTVEELSEQLKAFKVDISKFGTGSSKTLESLFHELEAQECRMLLRGEEIIRVVDLLALRIKTKSSKYLIESEQTFKDGRTRSVNRLPAVMRQAGGSGLDRAKQEIKRLLASELNSTPDVIQVAIKVEDPQQEQTSYKQTSQSYPGLTTVYRKTFFDATVKESAPPAQLLKLGLPDETCFKTELDGEFTSFKWATEEELENSKVVVRAPQKKMAEFEGFKPLICPSWTEEKLGDSLKQHRIDTSKFGVGTARSIKEFVEETNTGETRLFSNGSELRRHLDILIVKIKNPIGAYLIETGHSFGKGQTRQKNAFPATKVRPFEDKVWAVRRLLGEVDIPYSSSKIIFGPRRIEKQESPSYPGVITVYLKQVVEVQLMEIDVANLGGTDLGKDKWFISKPDVMSKRGSMQE
jgi:serine/threonine protein kinase